MEVGTIEIKLLINTKECSYFINKVPRRAAKQGSPSSFPAH